MSFLQQILSPRRPVPANDSGETMPRQMNLEERMVYRRDLMFECIGDAMERVGIPDSAYRLRVARTDRRGHSFVVMIDISGEFLQAETRNQASLDDIGRSIIAGAKVTGLIAAVGVYWCVGQVQDGLGARQSRAMGDKSAGPVLEEWSGKRLEIDSRTYSSDMMPISDN
jgi:hypothetical protein